MNERAVKSLGCCAFVVLSLAVESRASAASTAQGDVKKPDEKAADAATDAFRIGAFAGVGFPRPLSIEGMIKVHKVVGVGLEYSVLPKLSVSGIDTTLYALNGDLRVFPFENGFFIGLAGGRQHLGASTTLTATGLGSITEQITADTWFINPRIGFLSTWKSGFTLGIDAGLQIPLSATFSSTLPSAISEGAVAMNTAHLFGKSVLPTVDLVRIGFLF